MGSVDAFTSVPLAHSPIVSHASHDHSLTRSPGACTQIAAGVRDCVTKAGKGHILNLGHGVLQGTPERAVQAFVDAAKAM